MEFHPVKAERLPDLARFSEQHGKFSYCSCMRWRLTSGEFARSTRKDRSARLANLVRYGTPVGVLAYQDGEPVGWCSISPRETYDGLERYRGLPRIDDANVWSVVCFFVDRRVRRQGVTLRLPRAAIGYARAMDGESWRAIPWSRAPVYIRTWARQRHSKPPVFTTSPRLGRQDRSCDSPSIPCPDGRAESSSGLGG